MIRLHRNLAIGAIAAAVVVASACETERAITTEPVGELAFGTTFTSLVGAAGTTNLPRGVDSFPATPTASAVPSSDSNRLTLRGLDSLTKGVYAVWVGNDSGTVFRRATGNLIVTRVDTTLNASGDPVVLTNVTTRTNVSSFAVGGPNYAMSFRFARTGVAGLGATDSATTVLVTVETSAAATTPGSRRFLWARSSQGTGTGTAPRVATLRFGNYAPRTANEFVYANNGISGVIPRGRASVRGNALVVMDSNFLRPPLGFYYAAWAIRFDTLGFQQLNNSVYLGRSTTPYDLENPTLSRQSLYDADSVLVDPRYVLDNPRVILAMANRVISDTIPQLSSRTEGFWRDFGRVVITLENKAAPEGVRPGPAIVLNGVLPPSVRGR